VGAKSPLTSFTDVKGRSEKRAVRFVVSGLAIAATAAAIIGTELLRTGGNWSPAIAVRAITSPPRYAEIPIPSFRRP
jgi:hypothetical protein